MFEKASRKKLRFNVASVGVLTVEDLWDLPLTQLDKLAVSLNRQIKDVGEESFIANKKVPEATQLSFDIVKHIIDVKIAEAETKKLAMEKKAKREKLLQIIEEKQNETDRSKSIDDLRKELAELED